MTIYAPPKASTRCADPSARSGAEWGYCYARCYIPIMGRVGARADLEPARGIEPRTFRLQDALGPSRRVCCERLTSIFVSDGLWRTMLNGARLVQCWCSAPTPLRGQLQPRATW